MNSSLDAWQLSGLIINFLGSETLFLFKKNVFSLSTNEPYSWQHIFPQATIYSDYE